MEKTIHGTIHGKTIELHEEIGLIEGQEVEVTVRTAIPGRSFSSGLIAPFHLPFRKASWQNVYLAFPF
jgi:hypothetical protein